MANDLVTKGPELGPNLMVTQADIDAQLAQRELFFKFVNSQIRPQIDAGTLPGAQKPSLYQPGAQKFARLFALGAKKKRTDMILDRNENFASVTYKASIYSLKNPDVIIAECEGVCSSWEKKYKERNVYNDKREVIGREPTPVCDILNTLVKMAQKRAYVGAIIEATGASDFYTQDIDDIDDADAAGVKTDPNPSARVSVVVPKTTSARSEDQSGTAKPPVTPNAAGPTKAEQHRNRGAIAKEIFEASKALGMPPAQVDSICTDAFGVARMNATDDQLEQLASHLKNMFEAKKGNS